MGKNCVFSAGPKLLLRAIPKKVFFLGNLLEYIFYHFSSSWSCFFTGPLSEVHDFRRTVRKNGIFSCPKNDVFSGEKERCFLVPAQGCGFFSLIICEDLRQKSKDNFHVEIISKDPP